MARDLQSYCAHFPSASDRFAALVIVFTLTKLIDWFLKKKWTTKVESASEEVYCPKQALCGDSHFSPHCLSPVSVWVAQSGRVSPLLFFGSMTDCVDNLSGGLVILLLGNLWCHTPVGYCGHSSRRPWSLPWCNSDSLSDCTVPCVTEERGK